jgi:succinoglycan biosynthesis protein ExoO
MTRASIIIPAFNAERSIQAAITSAQQQSERDIEILVIDDASSDATYERVVELAAHDLRIKPLRADRNGGQGAARNIGLAHATGEWIALLDSDDRYCAERIATLCGLGMRNSADLVADNLLLCPEGESGGDQVLVPRERLSNDRWLGAIEFVDGNLGDGSKNRNALGFLKPVVRRDFLERTALRYDETRFGEDYLFFLNCLMRGASWFITPAAMYFYTVRKGSVTESATDADLLHLSSVERRLSDEVRDHDPALAVAIRRHGRSVDNALYWSRFARAIKRGDWRTARDTMLHDSRAFAYIWYQGLRALPRVATAWLASRLRSHRTTS